MNDVRRYKDAFIETAMSLNQGMAIVNKFGRAPSGVQTTATDIWDRADATPTQQIWTAPTQARVHNIASSSAEDGAGTLTGALTVRVYGLTDWDTAEVNEDITMNGTGNVATTNSYVIIHRMKVLTAGSAPPNVGIISATAVTDSTVTAAILAGQGQTQMAIYGIPSTQRLLLYNFTASQLRATAGATIATNINILVNEDPGTDIDLFLVKETDALYGAGSTVWDRVYKPPKVISGPAIIKLQATANAADVDMSASFDGLLVTV